MVIEKSRSTIDQFVRLNTFIRDPFVNNEHVSVFENTKENNMIPLENTVY